MTARRRPSGEKAQYVSPKVPSGGAVNRRRGPPRSGIEKIEKGSPAEFRSTKASDWPSGVHARPIPDADVRSFGPPPASGMTHRLLLSPSPIARNAMKSPDGDHLG